MNLRKLPRLSLLVLGGSLLVAPESLRAAPPGKCPDPSPTLCKTKGYLATRCGLSKAAMCKDAIDEALVAAHERSKAPKRKMLAPGGSAVPDDVRVGKYRRYTGPKSGRTKLAKVGTNPFAEQRYSFVPSATPKRSPSTAHRNPAWEANGNQVGSCQEYAYEKLYDWMRFIDAAAACRGNEGCVVDIGLMDKTPGLAHPMKSRNDKESLETPLIKKSKLPKNVFFQFGDKFVYAEGPGGVAPDPKWDKLAEVMRHGEEHHYVGVTPPKPGKATGTSTGKVALVDPNPYYKDEWDFHATLRKGTKDLTLEEQEEFGRRRRLMKELMDMWTIATAVEAQQGSKAIGTPIPEIASAIELPLDIQSDPFEYLQGSKARVAKAKAAATKVSKALGAAGLKTRPGAGWISKPVAGGTVGLRSLPEIDAELRSLMAAPGRGRTRGPARGGPKVQRLRRSRPGKAEGAPAGRPGAKQVDMQQALHAKSKVDPFDIPCTKQSFDPYLVKSEDMKIGGAPLPVETLGWGPISCRIGMLTRLEWQRHLAGQRTCLTLDDPACDWDPSMFTDRFVETAPFLEDYTELEVECTDWADKTLASGPLPSTKAVEQAIDNRKFAAKEAFDALDPYHEGVNTHDLHRFRYEWSDEESWGDQSTFGASYASSLGWSMEGTSKGNTNDACDFAGNVHADLSVRGYLVGTGHTVVDVLGRVAADPRQARYDARLVIMGKEVFDEKKNVSLTKAWEPSPWGKTLVLPKPKPQIHIQAGPVPVTGSAWAELFLGTKLGVDGHPGSCANGSAILAKASIGPTARLGAAAQAGVGISGIASAGIRGYLDLVEVGLPFTASLGKKPQGIGFSGGLDMTLAAMSGRLALYIEYLIGEDEFEIVSWKGIGPETVTLFELPSVVMPLEGFDQ